MAKITRVQHDEEGRHYIQYKCGRAYGQILYCEDCGSPWFAQNVSIKRGTVGKYCGRCRRSGKNNPQWKCGRKRLTTGYIYKLCRNHPYANIRGYVMEHRLVMESHLKRILNPREEIHHINGIKDDNRIENLQLFRGRGEHQTFHNLRNPNLGRKKRD